MNILIVEDESSLAGALEHILQKAGHITDWVSDGQSALDYIRGFSYDLILLDVMLPRLDGFSVVHQIRTEKIVTPVLMLTARTTVPDKVEGLDAGADDYLTKPFDTDELLARVRAMTRRTGEVVINEISFGDVALSLNKAQLSCGKRTVQLSPKEFQVIRLLMGDPQMTFTKELIIDRAWGMDSDITDNNVEAYISFLRKKLRYLKSHVAIKNLQKIGYHLEMEP
ncbi:MAG TPA: DNA-binding response regulator [Lachnospiraceae bacterium]|nr:DNA-binding response regulator [Lachnospiraceae bacterium]